MDVIRAYVGFRSSEQPFCRGCGKPIPKATDSVYFTGEDSPPLNREEAQKRINQKVISVKWRTGSEWDDNGNQIKPKKESIMAVGTWDGESYRDEFFCKNQCAIDLGYAMARRGWKLEQKED